MQVDIYISERSGSREIRIPWLPETIQYGIGEAIFASYDIMSKGTVSIPTGSELGEYSWEGIFPGEFQQDSEMQRGTWRAPKEYQDILNDWKVQGTPLRLMVTGYPINKDVHLQKFTAEATGAFGGLDYEVAFLEDRDITISSSAQASTQAPKRAETQSGATSYIVKKGDTLWTIAQRFYGTGTKWQALYQANKDIIESTAKKQWKAAGKNRDSQNGHWIFPGTKISIPR